MAKRGNGEGTIYRRSDGRWCATVTVAYRPGKQQRKTFYGKTRREVQEKLTAVLRARQQGIPVITERQTVASFCDRWLDDVARPRLRPLSFVAYRGVIEHHVRPAIGRVYLHELTPQHVQHMLNDVSAKGLAPRTVRNVLRVLHSALETALRWNLVARNVAALVTPPRIPHSEEGFLSPEEAKQFLAVIEGDRLEALYKVALATGLRQGEALGLQWSRVDLAAAVISVTHALQVINGKPELVEPKSAASRRLIPVPTIAIEALHRHRARQIEERLQAGETWSKEWDLVFTNQIGEPLSSRRLRNEFKAHLTAAGLEDKRFHDLRHSCASLLLAQGVPMRVVMEILGHSNIQVTMDVYSHVTAALSRQAADSIDAILKG